MSTDHHDPITNGAPANSAVINAPLAQLDQAIKDIDFTPSGNPDEFLNGNRSFSVPAGTGSTNGHVIQEEGVDLAQKGKLDFQGASVKAQTGATATEVVINGAVLAKNIETLSGSKTLTDASEPVQALTITADQDVNLPAEAVTNPFFVIFNDSDSGFTLAVKDDSPTTIVEIEDGESALLFSDGAHWFAFTGGDGGGGGGLTSPLTTKGDIWVFTSVDARLGVGSNGQVLTADSAEASGMKWATPSSSASGDGWVSAGETWTYASATTINVPSGAASKYGIGDRARFKQGGSYKYVNIIGVADTLLTVTGGNDYSVANAAITDNDYSKSANPLGWPQWFNWTPVFTGFSVDPTNTIHQFEIRGKMCKVNIQHGTNGTSNSNQFTMTLPVAAVTMSNYSVMTPAQIVNNGAAPASPGSLYVASGGTVITVYTDWLGTLWATSNGKRCRGELEYRIA